MTKYYRLAEHMGPSDVVWQVTEQLVKFRVCSGGRWHLSSGTPYLMQQHIDSGRVVECDKPLD